MTQEPFSYQIGGSLANQSPSYIVRNTDHQLEQALKLGEFCYILNSRQMGKSSLRVRAMEKLQAAGNVCVAIDLTGMGTQDLTPEKWYAGVLRSLVSGCQLEFNWRSWWREKRDLFTPVQRLALFIEEILLVKVAAKIVVFIDEIDRVLSQKFSLDDFFALIHSCYQKRQVNPAYKRLTFTLLGVAAPRDLIRDKNQSPFEIGKAISLEGFKLAEAKPLMAGLTGMSDPQQTLAEILAWTGGQPFLTQKLCQLVSQAKHKSATNLVSRLVEQYLIKNWEVQDEPEHLRTIRDRLTYRNSQKTIRLLSLYQEILDRKQIPLNNSAEQIELRLSGLVTANQGILRVSNPIYAQIFNSAWISQQLEQLRPYSQEIANWLKDQQSDRYLLQEQELQTALIWSLDKSLADVDYQFLVASQNLAQQKTKTTLAAVEAASKLLANTRKRAKYQAKSKKLGHKKLSLIALSITVLTILLRCVGIFQSWEWNLLDRFFRWRLTDELEPRITVITIDEQDLQLAGQWPISDRTLATALNNLLAQSPQAIGIDIYRDSTVSHNRQLLKLLAANPHLYIVEKAVGDRVLPPAISQTQVGFADQILDSDGKIRRALLSIVDENKQLRLSLGTQLALNYLQEQEITLQSLDRHRNALGKAVFHRFKPWDGGYVDADAGGYQILLNFWGTKANFRQYSLTQVLNNEMAVQDIHNCLILIGITAESLKDSFYTPYSGGWFNSPPKMSGVFIHANVASQIIGAAINNRPLLRTQNKLSESLWILLWGIVGTIIAWRLDKKITIAISMIIANLMAIAICYSAFLLGWWLPLIPVWLTLNAAAIAVLLANSRQQERVKLQFILNQLSQEPNAIVRKIALEYYKQSENQQNQALIAQKLNIERRSDF